MAFSLTVARQFALWSLGAGAAGPAAINGKLYCTANMHDNCVCLDNEPD